MLGPPSPSDCALSLSLFQSWLITFCFFQSTSCCLFQSSFFGGLGPLLLFFAPVVHIGGRRGLFCLFFLFFFFPFFLHLFQFLFGFLCSLFQSCSLGGQGLLCVWDSLGKVVPLEIPSGLPSVGMGCACAWWPVLAVQAIKPIPVWLPPVLPVFPVIPVIPLVWHGSWVLSAKAFSKTQVFSKT